MDKFLTICPSKGHPEKLDAMLKSFTETSSYLSEMIVGLENSDQRIKEYLLLIQKYTDISFRFFSGETTTQIYNQILKDNPNYAYYHQTNDDVIYRTKWWDMLLARASERKYIVYGDDLFQGENLPTFPFIPTNIVHTLGWLQMPKLTHGYNSDVIWKTLGKQTKLLKYVPSVIIEHKWDGLPESRKLVYDQDMKAFVNWLAYKSNDDISRVKEAMNVQN